MAATCRDFARRNRVSIEVDENSVADHGGDFIKIESGNLELGTLIIVTEKPLALPSLHGAVPPEE